MTGIASFRFYLVFAAVLVSALFTSRCSRLVLPPLPEGVPEGASFDRRNRLWILYTADRELGYYASGKPAFTGEIHNGRRDGLWFSYAPDGLTVTTTGRYRNGRRDGVWIHRDDSGRLYVRIRYSPEPADPVLTAVSPEIGNENGPFERYYPDGQIELSGSYRAGRFDGMFRRYRRTGQLEYEGRYREGVKEGLWKIYDGSGALLREENYQNGELEGRFRIFDRSRLIFETVYKDGIEIGPRRILDRRN
jgi:antitoxin component YwqK of YwqJK toxin-antitoxin module